jgi:predicted phage terminase large subunit-like protein
LEEISRRLSERHSARDPERLRPRIKNEDSELAREHLAHFTRQAWHILEPATTYLHNWHVDCISEHLEAVSAGQIKRLLVNIPPRYMKSISITIMWPVWEWIKRPELRYLFDSYSEDLMQEHNVARRTIIESEWYQSRYSDSFQLRKDDNRKSQFTNTSRGVMIANRSATGKGGNRVIIDDPLDPQQAYSDAEREAANRRFKIKLSNRLNNKKEDVIVVVMQRVHEKDVSGEAMAQGYHHLKLPVEVQKRVIVHFPISGRIIVRKPGELLWPEREGPDEIAAAKRAMGTWDFATQYLQEPAPIEGGILKRDWWRWYRQTPGRFDEIIQSWDLAFKDNLTSKDKKVKASDMVAGQVWGRRGGEYFLLDYVCERMSFTATIQAIRSMRAKWPNARRILIEDAANGPAVMDALKKKLSGLIAVSPDGTKLARVHAVSPEVEAGNVYLPLVMDSAGNWGPPEWAEDFVRICALFPNVKNDDAVDAFTQALRRLSKGGVGKVRETDYTEDNHDED